jgi:hypothetical protein
MIEKTEPTFWTRIYMSGAIEIAEQIIRKDCLEHGLCVTIMPNKYIYTGGEELGFVIELINYPRFPASSNSIKQRAISLAKLLLEGTYQHSVLIMTPIETLWITKRES